MDWQHEYREKLAAIRKRIAEEDSRNLAEFSDAQAKLVELRQQWVRDKIANPNLRIPPGLFDRPVGENGTEMAWIPRVTNKEVSMNGSGSPVRATTKFLH